MFKTVNFSVPGTHVELQEDIDTVIYRVVARGPFTMKLEKVSKYKTALRA
jgi:hypothetical protein